MCPKTITRHGGNVVDTDETTKQVKPTGEVSCYQHDAVGFEVVSMHTYTREGQSPYDCGTARRATADCHRGGLYAGE